MTIRLTDGRTLGYAEYGDPSGKPVLFFHGATLSRLFGAAADASARRVGVRLIAPDRPGIGLSDPQPGRTLLDWSADVGQLADRLDLGRFSVLGHSLGGAYVLACAYTMPKRLIGAGVAAGAIPVGPNGELPVLLRMSPTLVAILLTTMTRLLMFGPQRIRQKMRAADPPSDRELFESPEFAAIVERSVLEGLRRGVRGIRSDAAVLALPCTSGTPSLTAWFHSPWARSWPQRSRNPSADSRHRRVTCRCSSTISMKSSTRSRPATGKQKGPSPR
jgi:pimeloyl-ACP methyl ester carboxylesterase